MNMRLLRVLTTILILAGGLHAWGAAAGPAVISLKGEINAQQLETLRSGIAQAEKDGASGIIVEIDSFGGPVETAFEEIDALLATKIPTAAFVNTKAMSAASLLTLATDKIYLHPSAVLGASAVESGNSEDANKTAESKATSIVVAKARATAKAKGHPEDVAEAFISREAEVVRGDKTIDGKESLLMLSATDATNRYYGHTLLAEATASDVSTVAQLAGFSGTVGSAPAASTSDAAGSNPSAAGTGPIFVVPINGEVGEPQFFFLRRALKEAQRANARAVILEVDTFGGRVDSAMEEMDTLLACRIPTYAFVNTKAISAGSMVSLATKKIYMHPSAVIGASAVVAGGGEDLNKTMEAKATSMVVAKARGTAKANGHPEDVAEAFIRVEAQLTRNGKVIDGPTTLLTLNASEATQVYDGVPLLAEAQVSTVEELMQKAGLTGTVRRFEPSGFETLAFWITAISPLLLIGGMIGAYIEMKIPGFGIPGICSIICFALFFGGNYIAGLAGMEAAIVFVIGLVLVLAEFFLMPGTVIPGLIGTLLMLGAIVFAMVDQWPADGGHWTLPSSAQLERPMFNLLLAIAGAGVAVALLAKFLPKTSLYGRLVLSNAVAAGPGVTVPVVNMAVKPGDTGKAVTTLRPAGKAEIGGETHDVITLGDFITLGTGVRVVSIDGMRIVVEPSGTS